MWKACFSTRYTHILIAVNNNFLINKMPFFYKNSYVLVLMRLSVNTVFITFIFIYVERVTASNVFYMCFNLLYHVS